jgi:hypothetical protein
MLPPLPTPIPRTLVLPPLRRVFAAVALAMALLLPLGLSGCGGPGQPSHRVLLDALALQIRLTQEQVAVALGLPSGGLPEVSRVRVESQEPLRIGEARGLRLSGRFDWRLSGDPIRVDSPFTVFLQRGERGESWRLAQPAGSAPLAAGPVSADAEQQWFTYPLPLPGERRPRTAATFPLSG